MSVHPEQQIKHTEAELIDALGLLLSVADVRAQQWIGAATNDYENIIDELYEASSDECSDMHDMILAAADIVNEFREFLRSGEKAS